MKISTVSFVEHRTAAQAYGSLAGSLRRLVLVMPGACTSCNGSTSSSCCCCGGKESVRTIRTFSEAAQVFPQVQAPSQVGGGVAVPGGRVTQAPGG